MSRQHGFWRRQFDGAPTRRQTVFDILMGIVLPCICLVADPVVFDGWWYRSVAYTFVTAQMAVLAVWMLLRRRLAESAIFFTGPLMAGGLFALGVGLVMLPLTLVGMVILIGFLGLTPFFTALAFLRNAVRALRQGARERAAPAIAGFILAGVLFAATLPVAVLYLKLGSTAEDLVADVLRQSPHSPWTVPHRGD